MGIDTQFTPGKLDRLTPNDWDTLARFGFPVHMCDVSSLQMWRLTEDTPTKPKVPKPTTEDLKAPATLAHAASSCSTQGADAKLWKNIPLPSIPDTTAQQVMTPKTLLDC